MNERNAMLKNVVVHGFALHDAALFLDNHPDCPKALAYYHKQQKAADQARTEYTAKYGPLTADSSINNGRWDWTDGPWPWEVD